MKINWKVKFKNPVFYAQVIVAIFTPILAYLGITAKDLTSWTYLGQVLAQAISNPYVLMLVIANLWTTINDPTTAGLSDSTRALNYEEPNKE